MTKSEIFDFISHKTNNQFIVNPLFEATIEDALNTKIIKNNIIQEPSEQYIIIRAIHNYKILLNAPNIKFKNILVSDYIPNKDEYLSQLSLLENLIES